jgi:hypothetical protein
MKALGIILITVGIVMMVTSGFNYTTRKTVLDTDRLEIDKKVDHPVQWSPIIGGTMVFAGIVVILIDRKKI